MIRLYFCKCTIAAPGVEVVSAKVGAEFVTTIHNGPFDGMEYVAATELGARVHHKALLELARGAAADELRQERRRAG
jgi:hypothetical protein